MLFSYNLDNFYKNYFKRVISTIIMFYWLNKLFYSDGLLIEIKLKIIIKHKKHALRTWQMEVVKMEIIKTRT